MTPVQTTPAPPDQKHRRRIVDELDVNMLVEAAAGTGKTTSIVNRMVELIRQGKCTVETMAAVTFTRKAAAELRDRFRIELQRAARQAEGALGRKLTEAAEHVERCFIGTIHAFCARLLRERPIEAGVDLSFQELDPQDDARLRGLAWQEHVSTLFARDDQVLSQLGSLGIQIGQLEDSFLKFADYPDVQEWPAPRVEMGDLESVRQDLASYVQRMRSLMPSFPDDRGSDKLMDEYERIVRMVRHRDMANDAQLMEVLARFNPNLKPTQKCWRGGVKQGKSEGAAWLNFAENTAQPQLERWRARRYEVVMRVLRDAVSVYDRLRAEGGWLNYQDLLIGAARLLRDRPAVRRYFRQRIRYLLVDEFQDTDPVQAEVMMLLTATDADQSDWRRCTPAVGSLFVVGDPKQSIYRFRRADIVTYNQVRRIIVDSGGSLVSLSTNFRTREQIVSWANAIFDRTFPSDPDQYAPAATPIDAGRRGDTAGELSGIHVLEVPAEHSGKKDEAVEYEASFIASWVRDCLDQKRTIPRSPKEVAAGIGPEARPADFMIVTRGKKHLSIYARKLQDLGVRTQVSGGSAWRQVVQLRLLADCLRALSEPENPVALVAVLRGELFGFSDADLYAFRSAGGTFCFRTDVPAGLAADVAERFRNAFHMLIRYWQWTRRLPLVSAVEKIASDLGLPAWALTEPGGNVQAGTIAKLFELLRAARDQMHGLSDVVSHLSDLIEQEAEFDGVPVRTTEENAVRIMNLHKVKGLEAPVVFLADPTGKSTPSAQLHIDRTGEQVRGHMAVLERSGNFQWSMVACPLDWKNHEDEEQRFSAAESDRLQYVAATRAGVQLVITRRAKRNSHSHWKFFEEHLDGCPPLVDPGEQKPKLEEFVDVSAAEVNAAAGQVRTSWDSILRPTYAVEAAKRLAVGAPVSRREPGTGEHGTEWGTLIHVLLESSIRRSGMDLRELAYSVLRDQELDASLLDDAIETVESVLAATILQRASAASKRLVEVPFELCRDAASAEREVPTLLRGVIDLAFLEPPGWVIVDYKTDAVTPKTLPGLVEHYRDQVNIYRDAWKTITGEAVKEAGLYFTRAQAYVVV